MAGPVLTPNTDGNPRVEVFFDPAGLPPGTASLRMLRFSENREWLVRGGVDVAPGVAALDYEVPFRTQATYRAACLDAAGVPLGFTPPSTITLDVEGTWVHQPLAPLLAVKVGVLADTARELVAPTVGEVVYTEDASVGTWVGRRRHALQGVPLSLLTETEAEANTLQAMLGTYQTQQVGVLCIRTSLPVRWPRTFFAGVPELRERELTVRHRGYRVRFDASVDEVVPPHSGLVVPLLSYYDLDAFGTYTAQDANWATYTARDRAYELAGLAEQ